MSMFIPLKTDCEKFPLFITRDALRGHTVSKNGTISFSS